MAFFRDRFFILPIYPSLYDLISLASLCVLTGVACMQIGGAMADIYKLHSKIHTCLYGEENQVNSVCPTTHVFIMGSEYTCMHRTLGL